MSDRELRFNKRSKAKEQVPKNPIETPFRSSETLPPYSSPHEPITTSPDALKDLQINGIVQEGYFQTPGGSGLRVIQTMARSLDSYDQGSTGLSPRSDDEDTIDGSQEGLDRTGGVCRCGYGSYCRIFQSESDADCYCKISSGLYLQDPNGICNVLEDHCGTAACSNGGTCVKSFGSYFCSCPPSHAGKSCQLPVAGKKKYAEKVSVYFDIHEQEVGGWITFFIFLKELGDDLKLRLDDGAGWVRDESDVDFKVDDPYSICFRHSAAIPEADTNICEIFLSREKHQVGRVELGYPVLERDDPRVLFSASGSPVGRIDTVRLEVVNGGDLTFSQEYTVFTHFTFRESACSMSPRLEQCSTSSSEPAVYSKDRDIIIRAVNKPTYTPQCERIALATHTWRIRAKNMDLSFPGEHIFKLRGSDLPFGLYTIEYRINIYGSEKLTLNKSDFPNFVRCWLEVRPVPVIAEILGGSLRTVKRRTKFKMDASYSRDPNYPHDSNLRYLWTCDLPTMRYCNRKGPVERLEALQVAMPVGEHTFTLNLRSEGISDELYSREKHQKIIVKATGDIHPRFFIVCCVVLMCENLNPGSVLCLEVAHYPEGGGILWSYREDGGADGPLGGGIRQEGTPEHRLILRAGSLRASTTYHFRAVHEDSVCEYSVSTNAGVKAGVCRISPTNGEAAETEYSLECQGFAALSNDTQPIFYQLYEKRDNTDSSLIRVSQEPDMSHLLLSSGDLSIRVVNRFGGFIQIDLSVTVNPGPAATENYVEEILDKMELSIARGDSTAAVACSDILASKLSEVMNKTKILERLVWNIRHIDLVDLWDGIRVLDCLRYLLSQVADGSDLSSVTVREAATVLSSVVSIVRENEKLLYVFQTDDTLQFARAVLRIVDTLLKSKDPRITEVDVTPFDYESSYLDYWMGFTKILTVLEGTANVLLDSMVQYQDELRVSSGEVFMVTKFASGKYLSEEPDVDPSGSGAAKLGLGQRFGVAYQHDFIQLQVIELKKDPFWWVKSELPANSHHLNIKMSLGGKDLTELKEYISITFQATEVKSEIVQGSVTQPKQSLPANEKNKFVSIHKIDRVKDGSGKLSVKFKDLESSLQVLLEVNNIPEAFLVRELGEKVNSNKPEFLSQVYTKESSDDILYLGILPSQEITSILGMENSDLNNDVMSGSLLPGGPQVLTYLTCSCEGATDNIHDAGCWFTVNQMAPTDESLDMSASQTLEINIVEDNIPHDRNAILNNHKEGENLSYEFEIQDELCRVWTWEEWNVRSCKVSEKSVAGEVRCNCRHLSFFGGSFLIPPNTLHLIADIQLFRNVLDNPYVLTLVLIFLLAYAGLLFWAVRMDKRDELSRGIHILPDNFPGDDYGFLLAVFTGVNANAGTSSRVGVRLFGHKAHGHPHILNFEKHFLQLGQDNWFLLFSQEYLGQIVKIHVWHNNQGPRPDWYCRKMLLYDLTSDRQYIFEVERWLTLRSDGAQWILRPVSQEVPQSLDRLAKDNVFSSLRERHNWFSVFAKDPRSGYSRSEKLTIGLTVMIVAMFAAILFYGVAKEYREDQPEAEFGMREIIIMLEITAISIVMSTIVIKLFQMSKNKVRKNTEKTKVHKAPPDNTERKGKVRGWMKKFVQSTLVLEPLQTIHMASKERQPLPLHKKVILIIAWTVSTVIILGCGFFLVLYGLKFGPNKSLIWISVVLLNIGKTVFFTQPLKVTALALAATFCLKIPNRETLTFEVEPRGVKSEIRMDRSYMRKLLELRSHPMYRPLSQVEVMIGLEKQERVIDKWDLVNLLLVTTIYLLLLIFNLSTGTRASHHYTQHIYHMFNPNSTGGDLTSLHNVYDKESFFHYLMYDFLPALHVKTLYNGEPLPITREEEGMDLEEVKGWTRDYMNRLLGVPRLRQLRVMNGSCDVAEEMSDWFGECHGLLAVPEVEANGENWKKEGPLLWNYSSPQESESIPVFGASSLSYPGGGYIQKMTEDLINSQHKLARLYLRNWFDSRTRAIIVEFNLYNGHGNIFALISLIVECLPSGVYTTRLYVDSAQYEFFRHTGDVKLVIVVSIFLVIVLLLLMKLITDISVEGFLTYMKNWEHIVKTLVVIFSLSSIIAVLVRAQYFSFYSKKFYEPVRDVFVSFIYPFQQDDILLISLCLLTIIITIRFLTLAQYGKYCFVVRQALKDSLMLIFVIIFLLIFFTTLIGIVMFSCRIQHSFIFPILPIPRIKFINFYDKVKLQNESITFPILVNLIYLFFMVLMTCVLIYNYGMAKFKLEVLGVGKGYTNRFPTLKRLSKAFRRKKDFKKSRRRFKRNRTEEVLQNGWHQPPVPETKHMDGHSPYRKHSGRDALGKWLKGRKTKHGKTNNQLNTLIDIFENESITV